MPQQEKPDPQKDGDIDAWHTPGSAEGDRETVEQDLLEKSGQSSGRPVAGDEEPSSTPSQAEGDRETVERDLKEKGLDRS